MKAFNVPIFLDSALFDSKCNNAPKFYVNRNKFKPINFKDDVNLNRNMNLFPKSNQGNLMYRFFSMINNALWRCSLVSGNIMSIISKKFILK